jgi:hypothetical protein
MIVFAVAAGVGLGIAIVAGGVCGWQLVETRRRPGPEAPRSAARLVSRPPTPGPPPALSEAERMHQTAQRRQERLRRLARATRARLPRLRTLQPTRGSAADVPTRPHTPDEGPTP